jgi:hypothetical protein
MKKSTVAGPETHYADQSGLGFQVNWYTDEGRMISICFRTRNKQSYCVTVCRIDSRDICSRTWAR